MTDQDNTQSVNSTGCTSRPVVDDPCEPIKRVSELLGEINQIMEEEIIKESEKVALYYVKKNGGMFPVTIEVRREKREIAFYVLIGGCKHTLSIEYSSKCRGCGYENKEYEKYIKYDALNFLDILYRTFQKGVDVSYLTEYLCRVNGAIYATKNNFFN